MRPAWSAVFTLLVGEGFVPPALTRRVLAIIGDRGLLAVLHAALILLELIELTIPPLLAWGALPTAVHVVWAFHLVLGSIAYDYSVIAVASLVVCAPSEQVVHLGHMSTSPLARLAALTLALVCCTRLEAARCRELGSPEHFAAMLWICAIHPAWWVAPTAPTPPGLLASLAWGDAPPLPLALTGSALLLAAVLNGLGPYLGYKTAAVWAMFSNLHVEGGRTNHWLVPASWQLVGYCSQLVTINETDSQLLRTYHTVSSFDATRGSRGISPLVGFAQRTGCAMTSHANSVLGRGGEVQSVFPYRIPWLQLRRMISVEVLPELRKSGGGFHVDYTLSGGERRRFEVRGGELTPGSDPRLAVPPPLLLQKLTTFKSVLVDDARCGVCHGP